MDSAYNQQVLSAISGTAATPTKTTLSTGTDTNFSGGGSNEGGGALPSMAGIGGGQMPTMNSQMTQQQFGGMPQMYNPFQAAPYQPVIRHGIGKDQWSSSMGLDHQAILNSLGLGGA